MKHNAVPQDVEEMSFNRLTIVYNKPGAEKSYSPVNPEAVLVAVKGAEDKSGIAKAFDALKSLVVGPPVVAEPTPGSLALADHAKKDAEDGDGSDDNSPSAVDDAKDEGLRSALMNAAYDHATAMSGIMNTPGFTDKQRKDAIVKHVADHALTTSSLASEYFGGKASIDEGVAVKAGAVHSAATVEQLAQTHQHLADAHAAQVNAMKKMQAAHDATGKAMEHTGKLLGKHDSVDHADKPVTDSSTAASADSATKSLEDEMTKEDIAALVAGISDAVKAAIVEAMPKPIGELVAGELKPALDTEALKALLAEQAAATEAKMEARITAAVTSATEAASKSAIDASKSELDKLTEAAEKANADAVAKATEATKAREQLDAAVKASRDRQSPGGHEDAQAAEKAKAARPKSQSEIQKELAPLSHVERIKTLLHS